MTSLAERLESVKNSISEAESEFGRAPGSVKLLAVSKTRPPEDIRLAFAEGQTAFGENYLQDAIEKITTLSDLNLEWHFIGRIQSNKTRTIAEHFDWVHGVEKLKHARRLSEQRPAEMPPLKICLQVNISREQSKGGLLPEDVADVAAEVAALDRIDLAGLMAIPAPCNNPDEQHIPFRELRLLRDRLATDALPLETLSMGMSGDMRAAIAEGATIVRIGTAIFGPRAHKTDT